jgi:hypothetical protein
MEMSVLLYITRLCKIFTKAMLFINHKIFVFVIQCHQFKIKICEITKNYYFKDIIQ